MPRPINGIRVEDGILRSSVIWPRESMRTVSFVGRISLVWRGLNLWDNEIEAQLKKIDGFSDIVQGLASLCAPGGQVQITPIYGDIVADRTPWEACDNYFIERNTAFHPVRILENEGTSFSPVSSPLRVVLLMGHPGAFPAFDFNGEVARLQTLFAQASTRLNQAQLVGLLDLTTSSETSRRGFFQQHRPDVVFYFGHGRAADKPGVRIGPGSGDWLPINDLADAATASGVFPPHWLFVACSVGSSPDKEHSPAGPAAFRTLAKAGARAMLAMRARIRTDLARITSQSLVESLCGGVPLELAAGIARKAARRSRENDNINLLDWAAPAIWSQEQAVASPPIASENSLVALNLSRLTVDDPGMGLVTPDDGDMATGNRWLANRRVQLDTTGKTDAELGAWAAKVLGAVSHTSDHPVLFARLADERRYELRLAQWANEQLDRLNNAPPPPRLSSALRRLAKLDLEGLQELLNYGGIVLFLSSAPSPTDSLAWSILEDENNDAIIVVGNSLTLREGRPGWTYDRLPEGGEIEKAITLARSSPRTAALLCAMNSPINLHALATIADEPQTAEEDLPGCIQMPAGVVLSSSVRSSLTDILPPQMLTEAHMRLFGAREASPPLLESDDPFGRIKHLVAAQTPLVGGFVNEWVGKRRAQWSAAFWLGLARVLQPARDYWPSLESHLILFIATELVEAQNLNQAGLWLDALQTENPQQKAWENSLKSEIEKAKGTPLAEQRMWATAREAVRLGREALETDRDNKDLRRALWGYEANLARLELYFNHNSLAARDEYIRLKGECEDEPNPEGKILVPILRNLAECLFEFAPFREEKVNQDEARTYLFQAQRLAADQHLDDLRCEVLYSTAKLDELQQNMSGSAESLRTCIEVARSAGHVVCQRIAAMRLYRLEIGGQKQSFEFQAFAGHLRRLEYSRAHAWARRYAMQTRIWGARRVEGLGLFRDMASLLQDNVNSLNWSQDRTSSGDRRAIALSFAGLATIEARATDRAAMDTDAWRSFLDLEWAVAMGIEDPINYWMEGH